MAVVSDCPMDIICTVFLFLPAKSLLRLKCVCKSWLALISSPHFVKSYPKLLETIANWSLIFTPVYHFLNPRQEDCYLPYTPNVNGFSHSTELMLPSFFGKSFDVIGSCNGLICLYSGIKLLALCNPSTGLFRLVPNDGRFGISECFGFGYDHLGDDYKIIRILPIKLMVYSLRTDSWKTLRYRGRYPEDRYHSVLVNNRLHWRWNLRKILSFDLHDEQCREVSLPPYDSSDLESISLAVLDDCLCATISISPFSDDGEGYSDIWIMKEYEIEESWAKV